MDKEENKTERYCKNEKEVGEAIKAGVDTIYVEYDAGKKIVRIKATGKVAWGVCAASLAAAIALYQASAVLTVAPPAGAVSFASATVIGATAMGILGPAAIPAVVIGVVAGGIGALNTLRDKYKIVEKNDKYIKLKKYRN